MIKIIRKTSLSLDKKIYELVKIKAFENSRSVSGEINFRLEKTLLEEIKKSKE